MSDDDTLVHRLSVEDRHVLQEERRTAVEALVLASVVGTGGLALVAFETLETTGLEEFLPHVRSGLESYRAAGGLWETVLWLFGIFVALLVVVALSEPYRDAEHAGAEVARSRLVAAVRTTGLFVVAGLLLQMAITVTSALRGAGLLQHVVELVACAVLGMVAVSLSATAPAGLLGPALTAHHSQHGIEYFTSWGERRLPRWRRGYRRVLTAGLVLLATGLLVALLQAGASRNHGPDAVSGTGAGLGVGIFVLVVFVWAMAAWWTCGFATTFRRSSLGLEQYLGLGITHTTASLYMGAALAAAIPAWGALAAGAGTAMTVTATAGLWTLRDYEAPARDSTHRLARRHAHRLEVLQSQLTRALEALDLVRESSPSPTTRSRRNRARRFHRPYSGRD